MLYRDDKAGCCIGMIRLDEATLVKVVCVCME